MADRTVVYRIQADVAQAEAKIAALGASVKKSADDMTSATKEGAKFRQGLDTLGGAAGKIGLVAAVGLGAAVKKAADFDQAMSNISAATHETAGNMELLRAAALKAGADTAFSATEAASGVEELAKAGVATADILGGGLSGALDLAAAGGLGVAEAAETAATALTQFKLQGEDVPHVADLLAAAAGKAQGSVSDMGMALKQSGLVAAQTGLTIEETTGTLAAFASAGLVGSDAGTSFKTMLQALTPSGDKARKAMEAMGFSAYDAQGNFKGMTTVAGDLREGLSTMSKEQQNATLKTIFGSDAVRAAAVIYEQGAEGIGGWIDKTNDAGYAAETAAIKLDNLKGDLEALGGSLETALIGTGEGTQGPLRSLTQGLTGVINAYNDLGQGSKTGVAVTLGATAALGGGLFVFSKMVQGVAATRLAMEQLGISAVSTSKLMKGLGITAGVVAGLVAVTAAAEKLRSAFDENLPGVNELSGQLLSLSDGRIDSLGGEFDSLGDSVQRLSDKRWDVGLSDSIGNLVGVESNGLHDATLEIDALDAALANLASSGGTEVATQAFEDLARSQKLSADETKALRSYLPGYTDALAANENQATLTASSTDALADAHVGLTQRVAKTADQLKEEAAALKKARDAAMETAGGFVSLGAGVDDAKVSLGQWIKQLANQADALNNFMNNAKSASKRGLRDGLINDLQDAGTAGALRMKQLSNATDEEIAKANRAWQRGQDAMERYVDFKVPPKKVEVDFSGALSAIQIIRRALKAIPDEGVTVRVTSSGTGTVTPGFGPVSSADGSTVPNSSGPYRDQFLYSLAQREEVVSNRRGQADRFRPVLKAINADMPRSMIRGMLANGGTAAASASTQPHASVSTQPGPSIDYDRLTSAMLRARPTHGDVYVNGDPAEYKRQMMRDQQAESMGGRPR